MVLGSPYRVNILCLMHDTRLCLIDLTMNHNRHGIKKDMKSFPYKEKTGVYNVTVKSKDKTQV